MRCPKGGRVAGQSRTVDGVHGQGLGLSRSNEGDIEKPSKEVEENPNAPRALLEEMLGVSG